VYFPFDLHSGAVFDSHMTCRSHAVSLPYHEHAVLKATSQGHGRIATGERHGNDMGKAWKRHGMCKLASENGRVVAYSWQGRGKGTAWYV
jgi:hypothetical protein